MFNHRFRKSLILIGGSGEFGKKITKRFAKPLLKKWQVFNIDAVPNEDATANFIIEGLHEWDDMDNPEYESDEDEGEGQGTYEDESEDGLTNPVQTSEIAKPKGELLINEEVIGRLRE